MQGVAVRRGIYVTSNAITYRWRWRGILCRIVIGCVDVLWILHLTLHNRISHLLRDALPVSALVIITSQVRVLRYDTHG